MAREKEILNINEIQNYLDNNDLEGLKNNLPKLLTTYSKITNRMERIVKQSDKQQLEVLKLTETLEEKNDKINTLLNNAGQGFLYFDKDMIIGSEYSAEAKKIFKKEIAGENITHLLIEDENDRNFYQATLQGILDEDPIRQEILISLLPKEFKLHNKYIEVEYKILGEESFMLVLTNVTAQQRLAQKVKREQQILKMVVETVTTLEQFLEVKSDYENFIENIDSFKQLEKLPDLRREIHTYKGLFAQKEMLNIVEHLHDFETVIDDSLKKETILEDIVNVSKLDMFLWLDKDIDILKNVLGDDFFEKSNNISIDKNRILQIENNVKEILSKKGIKSLIKVNKGISDILKDIQQLTYHDILTYLKPYEKLVEQLGQKLEKYVNPLKIESEKIYLSEKYRPFLNSLVHIFRNSVDHGIETLDERYEKEKPENGTIKCIVKKEDENLKIFISDDGAGVDIEKIKDLAIEKGIYTQEEIEKLNEEEIILIIFKDAFSTSETITDVSGRGVGLASIVSELNKLNGTMKVNNNFGNGIEFIFNVPIH
jgi:two-component system chemotaxis sensor kinase CheA